MKTYVLIYEFMSTRTYMKVFKMQLTLCCPRQLLCRSNWIALQTAKKYFLRVIAILTYLMIVVKEIN